MPKILLFFLWLWILWVCVHMEDAFMQSLKLRFGENLTVDTQVKLEVQLYLYTP
jgi:hypothetical protein